MPEKDPYNPSACNTQQAGSCAQRECLNNSAFMIHSVVSVACEYERRLDLMQLVNFMDLYRIYITLSGSADNDDTARLLHSLDSSLQGAYDSEYRQASGILSFGEFVCNDKALNIVAEIASSEYGESVAVPRPLSAIDNAD